MISLRNAAELREGFLEYSTLVDMPSRMSLGVRMLIAFRKLELTPGAVTVRSISEAELLEDSATFGGLQYHFDLASRSPVSMSEFMASARYGAVQVAEHRDLPGVPVGAALAVPTKGIIPTRSQLVQKAVAGSEADTLVVFALATHPANLGAAAALMKAMSVYAEEKRLVAFSPLNGLRARLIKLASSKPEDPELSKMLCATDMPVGASKKFDSLLRSQGQVHASCNTYLVGNFHRHMGARLVDVGVGADPANSDAMWSRANFEYPRKVGS